MNKDNEPAVESKKLRNLDFLVAALKEAKRELSLLFWSSLDIGQRESAVRTLLTIDQALITQEYADDREPEDYQKQYFYEILKCKNYHSEETLRDKFAMSALVFVERAYPEGQRVNHCTVSKLAYDLADAMMIARK